MLDFIQCANRSFDAVRKKAGDPVLDDFGDGTARVDEIFWMLLVSAIKLPPVSQERHQDSSKWGTSGDESQRDATRYRVEMSISNMIGTS